MVESYSQANKLDNDPSAGSPTERFVVQEQVELFCNLSFEFPQRPDHILSSRLLRTHRHLACEQHP